MAGDDDAVWVFANGCTDGACGGGAAYVLGNVAVGAGVAVGDVAECLPDLALKGGARCGLYGEVKVGALACKVLVELLGGLEQDGMGGVVVPVLGVGGVLLVLDKPDANELVVLSGKA